jgi:hypothetical protein
VTLCGSVAHRTGHRWRASPRTCFVLVDGSLLRLCGCPDADSVCRRTPTPMCSGSRSCQFFSICTGVRPHTQLQGHSASLAEQLEARGAIATIIATAPSGSCQRHPCLPAGTNRHGGHQSITRLHVSGSIVLSLTGNQYVCVAKERSTTSSYVITCMLIDAVDPSRTHHLPLK